MNLEEIDPDKFEDFTERLLYTAIKVILKRYNMDAEGEEHEVDPVEEAAQFSHQKPLNSPEECLEYWNSCFAKGRLSCLHFREWWRQKVPKIFSPKPGMNYQKPTEHIEEEDVQKHFFDLLERFLCHGEPAEVFKQLSSLNDPPAQCGKVFKLGEPTYSCRDCGLDPTCVLCVDCFKVSEHGGHRYKMSTSTGGGYCDCGDPEAWKQFPYCATHIVGTQFENCNPLSKLPVEIQLRARQVFTSVLKYAYELLTLDSMMKLPGDLQYKERDSIDPMMDDLLEVEDLYATILYNDEVHTYEEVISTLQKAVLCDRNQAVSFVSMIDREGRSLVKCGSFQICSEVKKHVEKVTGRRGIKPLQVKVTHSHVVAHQIFALRLIGWLEGVLGHSEGFRALFSRILIEQEIGPNGRKQASILEGILRHDIVLWKAARGAVHHLLITGMLLEHASKKDFAIVFTNNYGDIIKDFIQDDHDHSFSVTSLSVQLFTVPTLAHFLIAKQDVLSTLLRTFMSECQKKRNAKGKLEFEKNLGLPAFRRTNYVLVDLRYLLSVPPEEFDDNTRKGFLHGYSMLLDILTWMQGMDSHIRQVNQHIEFEADWENGFNLHIKLAPVIALVLKWCSLDKVIFVRAYRMLLKRLKNEIDMEDCETIPALVQGKYAADVTTFNVASQAVSMHLPLTRLLGGLNLYLEKFGLNWDSQEVSLCERPSLVQVLELPLRTAVMVSQVYAGMWRRNGYSLQHQIFFYHNSRCRGEMYDRDIQLLQFCAATLPPDEFLVHCLNKFGLMPWAEKDFHVGEDESIRHIILLVEEFFALLITLIGERYTPGVGGITTEEMIRKEIIQLLCVEPLSHSALNKALPEDVNHETGLEKVISQVATFKMPTAATGKGVYELKDEYYEQYDVFFYHYTREDQSRSEESQRARLKLANQPQVCPPPQLPPLTANYGGLSRLLLSELLLSLLNLVLERADNLKSRCFSEDQVHKVLYLIGIGLLEEERLRASSSAVGAGDPFYFAARARDTGILSSLERLVGSHRIESHRELLAWVLRRMRHNLGMQDAAAAGIDFSSSAGADGAGSDLPLEEDAAAKARKMAAAAARRAKIMQQMAAQQKTFMTENKKLFEETPSGLRGAEHKASVCDWTNDLGEEEGGADSLQICLGPNRSQPAPTDSSYTCILCQEDEELDTDSRTLVMASFIQRSTVLSRQPRSGQLSNSVAGVSDFPFLAADLRSAPHTSSCGHVMHASCWQKYFDDVSETERRRYSRPRHPASYDVEKSEFLCPLCRSLSNSVITLIPQYHLLQRPRHGLAAETEDQVNGAAAVVHHCEPMEATEDIAEAEDYSVAMEVTNDEKQSLHESQAKSSDGSGGGVSEVEELCMVLEDQPLVSEAVATLVAEVVLQATDDIVHEPDSLASGLSSSSSSSTELGSTSSSATNSSDATFIIVEDGSSSRPSPPVRRTETISLSYSHWLEALFIALKYRKSLSPERMERNGGESQPQDEEGSRSAGLIRYYTCPLDQVVSEMEASHHDGRSFGRLFAVAEGGELAFPTPVYEIMNTFCQTTYRIALGDYPHVLDERIPMMVWISCSYTILSIVVSAMEAEKPVLGALSSRQNDCLATLIRFCGVVGSNFGEPKVIRSHSLKLLSTILEVDTSNPSILEIDMFGLLVSLTYSLPSLFNGEGAAPLPSCNIQDLHLLRLVYTAYITQLLFSFDELDQTKVDFPLSMSSRDCECILDLIHIVREPQGGAGDMEDIDPTLIWQKIMVQSLGFLRSCALFYHYLSGVAAPSELTSLLPPDQEYVQLTRYLSLPHTPRQLLNSDFSLALVRKWANHPNVHIALSGEQCQDMSFVLKVPELITLPDDYSELINSVSGFTCPRAYGDDSRAPSMCLVCGTVVCSQSYCCQADLEGENVGACTAHADACGARVGMFLRVRECKVVMLSCKNRGCFVSPPYLDQYGETDQGLHRGNPLRLNHERYKRLHRVWLNHGISEEVTRNIESFSGFGQTDWIHL